MLLLQEVSKDAKNEFFSCFNKILLSFNSNDDYKSEDVRRDDGNPDISKFKITLTCTNDIYSLLSYLFNDELNDLGFNKIRTFDSLNGYEDINQVFMIRPTFEDSHRLGAMLQNKRTGIVRVICLPEITDVYPSILERIIGPDFTIVNDTSIKKFNNVVELYTCGIYMVPVEGVLSMVMSNGFSEFYLDGDPTCAWLFAKSLEYLERRHLKGAIPQVIGMGILSKYVLELLVKDRRDAAANIITSGVGRVQDDSCFIPYNIIDDNIVVGDGRISNDNNERSIILDTSILVSSSFVIDRKIDLITPMCTNFTYEGLLDSIIGIENGTITVDSGVLNGKVLDSMDLIKGYSSTDVFVDKKSITLDSPLYNSIKWLEYNKVGEYLHERALHIKQGYEGTGMNTLGEMGDFVKRFKSIQQEHSVLSAHVNIMGWIRSYIQGERYQLIQTLEDGILQGNLENKGEDSKLANITSRLWTKRSSDPYISSILELIAWKINILDLYRLLILFSQVNGGIKKADFNTIRRGIIYQYGFKELLRLQNFVKCSFIKVNDNIDPLRWPKLCNKFNLLVDKEFSTSDYSNIFGGYAPLSLRCVQLLLLTTKNDREPLTSEFALLDTPIVSILQKKITNEDEVTDEGGDKSQSTHIIAYIGGITLGEIVAISIINSLNNKSKFIILTTNIINFKDLIN